MTDDDIDKRPLLSFVGVDTDNESGVVNTTSNHQNKGDNVDVPPSSSRQFVAGVVSDVEQYGGVKNGGVPAHVLRERRKSTGTLSDVERVPPNDDGEGARHRRQRRRPIRKVPLARRYKQDEVQMRKERRARRREKQKESVQTYCLCKSFDLDAMVESFRRIKNQFDDMVYSDVWRDVGQQHQQPRQQHSDFFVGSVRRYTDVVCLEHDQGGVTFVFEYGSVVLWKVSDADENSCLLALKPFMIDVLDEMEDDDYDFLVADKSQIFRDVITLSTDLLEEKLAVSFALAQSVRLNVFEEMVEEQIAENRELPEQLAETGHITLTSRELSKRIGNIFLQRSEVNLHSDILDTPDFFWEHDRFLEFFAKVREYLEIRKRASILNTRLDVMKEVLDMLAGEVSSRHETKLEWIIIILIMVEVALELGVMFIQLFWHKEP